MYFLDAVGRSLTIAGAKINNVQVQNSFFVNAALTGALVVGSGPSATLIQPDPLTANSTRLYQCDLIPNVNTDSDLARSVPQSIYFQDSYFANSWTGAIAFNSVFDPRITGSYFAFNYFNPYDYAGGTIFLDRCAAIGTVSNSVFDGTGLTTTTEGLEVHAARMTISGNIFRGFPGGGIVLHSSRAIDVSNNFIENNGLDWWDGSPGITVAIRVYNGVVGRLTEAVSILSNTVGNTGGSTVQRFGIKFSGCLDQNCTSHTMGTSGFPIRMLSNTFTNNRTAPACRAVDSLFTENVVSTNIGQANVPFSLYAPCQ